MDRESTADLTRTERIGLALGAGIADRRLPRALASMWQDNFSFPVLGLTLNDRLFAEGLDHVPQGESFIFAANHRTWFDLYAVMIATWRRFPQPPHLYCPVRTAFFYEKPAGIALNLLVSGNAMYPPVFRDQRGKILNQYAVERAVELLRADRRCVLAIHPEGRRNPSPDPYSFLPAKPGVGRIALQSGRPVIPAFVAGLPPTFPELVRERVSGRGTPVRVHLGPPVPLADFTNADAPEAWQAATDRVMGHIAALGAQDRAFMARRERT